MARKRRRRYFWARHFQPGDPEVLALSPAAQRGLEYARELAEDAMNRALWALEGSSEAPLTPTELARDQWGLSPVTISSEIKQARLELFGKELSDSGMAYRLKMRRERGVRCCAEAGCRATIPALADGRRRYCRQHGSPAARVRRNRRRAGES